MRALSVSIIGPPMRKNSVSTPWATRARARISDPVIVAMLWVLLIWVTRAMIRARLRRWRPSHRSGLTCCRQAPRRYRLDPRGRAILALIEENAKRVPTHAREAPHGSAAPAAESPGGAGGTPAGTRCLLTRCARLIGPRDLRLRLR